MIEERVKDNNLKKWETTATVCALSLITAFLGSFTIALYVFVFQISNFFIIILLYFAIVFPLISSILIGLSNFKIGGLLLIFSGLVALPFGIIGIYAGLISLKLGDNKNVKRYQWPKEGITIYGPMIHADKLMKIVFSIIVIFILSFPLIFWR